jgi:putative aldouronate transport system permease protein
MKKGDKNSIKFKLKNNIYLLILISPAIIFYVVFNIVPLYGVILAFKKFLPNKGILGSPWVGLDNFRFIFEFPDVWIVIKNTLIISFGRIIFGFWVPIVLALFLNELIFKRFKKVTQTILTFPHFLSWVIIAGFVRTMFSGTGIINNIIAQFGGEKQSFLSNGPFFLMIVFVTDIWKEAGWSSIIYLAVMSNIDSELYEAAEIDGAGRFTKMRYITLPGIKSMAIMLLLLAIGGVLSAGFDQIFNLYNPLVYDVADIIDTYIYRIVFNTSINQGVGVAVGLFKSVVSFILLFGADRIAKALGERGVF